MQDRKFGLDENHDFRKRDLLSWVTERSVLVILILFNPGYLLAVAGGSSAIATSAEEKLILVVNPDSNSLSLVGMESERVRSEIAVGIDPRIVAVNNHKNAAYVTNRGSNSVSIIDLKQQERVRTLRVGYRPYGLVVTRAGSSFFVAEQGSDKVRLIDATTFRNLAVIKVGPRPSALALSADGNILYVSHLLNSWISWIDVTALVKLKDHRISPARPISRNHALESETLAFEQSGHTIQKIDLWPDSNLIQSIVVSPIGQKAFIPHSRSNSSSRTLTFDTTIFPVVSVLDLETNSHIPHENLALGTLDQPGVGLPIDAAVTIDESELWIVNAASDDVTVIDLATRQKIAHIEVENNPRGIVLSSDGKRAYVNNTLAGTISVLDTSAYKVIDHIKVTDIPLPPLLLTGKRLFHSSDNSDVSMNQWISCNSCHFEGEHDGRTWFFNFSGPRNTTSLLGMIQTYPLRWSAEWDESADSEFAIRKENFGHGLIAGEMNCSLLPVDCVNPPPNQGRSLELDALSAFIDSLTFAPSPAHFRGKALSAAEKRGKVIFEDPSYGCTTCHPPPLYTDLQRHDVGTATHDERLGSEYDTPTLLGLGNSAPYFHDGSAATLADTINRPGGSGEHDISHLLSSQEQRDLIDFMEALPYEDIDASRNRTTPRRTILMRD